MEVTQENLEMIEMILDNFNCYYNILKESCEDEDLNFKQSKFGKDEVELYVCKMQSIAEHLNEILRN